VRSDEIKKGVFVSKIFYDAYEPMAEKEIAKIEKEAKEKFPIDSVLIKHRVGYVDVGEISFVVIVSSPHREEGFKAIQFIIDEVKRKAPIWKKEILSNGETVWV
jgi:molybdopterin synthase catalytic subunit